MTEIDESAVRWALTGAYRTVAKQNGGGPADPPRGPAPREGMDRVTASFDLMAALLGGCGLAEALTLVAVRAREIGGARLSFIALPAADAPTLTVALAEGEGADRVLGLTVRTSSSVLGRVYTTRRALSSRVAGTNSRAAGGAESSLPAGPILFLPLDTGEATRGVLAVAGHPTDLPLGAALQRRLALFAAMSASLIELAEERRAGLPAADTPVG